MNKTWDKGRRQTTILNKASSIGLIPSSFNREGTYIILLHFCIMAAALPLFEALIKQLNYNGPVQDFFPRAIHVALIGIQYQKSTLFPKCFLFPGLKNRNKTEQSGDFSLHRVCQSSSFLFLHTLKRYKVTLSISQILSRKMEGRV